MQMRHRENRRMEGQKMAVFRAAKTGISLKFPRLGPGEQLLSGPHFQPD